MAYEEVGADGCWEESETRWHWLLSFIYVESGEAVGLGLPYTAVCLVEATHVHVYVIGHGTSGPTICCALRIPN
jgi:hypothetical protein